MNCEESKNCGNPRFATNPTVKSNLNVLIQHFTETLTSNWGSSLAGDKSDSKL